jgi:transposase
MEARLAELEAQVKTHSGNSSKPPSSDPPWQARQKKKRKGKKPGGQPGHPGVSRSRLPPERVNKVVTYLPSACEHCQTPLSPTPAPNDPPPSWHQVSELPVQVAEVTEHQGHARTCSCCGTVTRAEIPPDIRARAIGPRMAAALSFLSGHAHCGKRTVQEIAETVFDTPVSLGTIANLEQEMSAALEAPHAEALAAVRAAPVKNVDETGWSKQGKLCWLWLAATLTVVVFKIHAKRGKSGLKTLLGRTVFGIVGSDRWGAYADLLERQICWAHLKRDFQKLFDLGGDTKPIGRAGRRAVKEVFALWHEFKAGRLDRATLKTRMDLVKFRLLRALQRGRDGPDKKTKRFCNRLLKVYDALWTFVTKEGVEPTNNHAERMVRPAVLWRKNSFGCHSAGGCRFAERILTTVQTLRCQNRPVLDYLHRALSAHRADQPIPALVAA